MIKNDRSKNQPCATTLSAEEKGFLGFLKGTLFVASLLTVLFASLILHGCGSAGNDTSSQVVSGMVAVGTPLSGQVSLKDSSQPLIQAKVAVIGPDGSYAFDVTNMKAPFILRADGHANGKSYRLHSFAAGEGTVNINPLTEVLVASAADGDDCDELFDHPDEVKMEKIRTRIETSTDDLLEQLRPLLRLFNAGGRDPIKDHFDADHHGLDGVLDHINISIVDSILTITNSETGAVIFTGSIRDFKRGHFTDRDEDLPRPTTVPGSPDDVMATGGSGQVTLTWESVSNATSYNLYYATTPGVTSENGVLIEGVTPPYVQTGLNAESTYYYVITAVNSAGESELSRQVSATTDTIQPTITIPASPNSLVATGGTSQVTVSWNSVSNATSYNLYYTANSAGVTMANGILVANVSSPAVLGNLTAGISYYFIVTAVNSAGESLPSVQAAAMTLTDVPTPTIPAVPGTLSVVGGTEQATISWSPADGATSYNLYWSTSATVTTISGTKVAAVSSPYVKTGLSAGTTYYFILTAVNSAGESASSSVASAATNAPPPAVPSAPVDVSAVGNNNGVTISWSTVTGATSYNLYWSAAPGVTTASTRIANAVTPYVQTGLTAGTTYYYIVTAVNSSGQSVASSQVQATTAPAVVTLPSAPTLSAIGGAKQLSLSWSPVSGATSYNLYWATTAGGVVSGTKISSVASPYALSGLAESTTYYAVLTAVNSAGESAPSTVTSATTDASTAPVCGSCHAIPPATGEHTFHVVNQRVGCVSCHGTGYNSTTVNAATHLNGVTNVSLSVWNASTSSCATYCHGSKPW